MSASIFDNRPRRWRFTAGRRDATREEIAAAQAIVVAHHNPRSRDPLEQAAPIDSELIQRVIDATRAGIVFALILLCLPGCASIDRQDNTARLIAHPEFKAAAQAAPNFTSECLLTITALEEQLARRSH